MLCECAQNLFLEKVLDASLYHSSTDLARAWVMSACARTKQWWQSLSLLPWLPPNLPWLYWLITAMSLVGNYHWLAVKVSTATAFVLPFDLFQ